jgi:hypothetical protein
LTLSCKDKMEEFDYGYEYCPVSVGNYKIYNVEEIIYENSDTVILNYQIKEQVTELFNINGEDRYKLERFKRAADTVPWPIDPDSVWSIMLNKSRIIKIENNTRFIKLVFPVENGKEWDGNAENSRGEDLYYIKNVGKPYTVLSNTFSKTAKVVQNDDSTCISRDRRYEVYAENVGMIYRLKEIYELTDDPATNNAITKKCDYHYIDRGKKTVESLISYGN